MKILGIETSCDETAASVVEDGERLLSNVVASSMDLHVRYGGVVPEIAARSHIEVILPVIEQALDDAAARYVDDHPGLRGRPYSEMVQTVRFTAFFRERSRIVAGR